ncbi:MAG: hypothetical protein Q9160_001670 [Pyrenula sp. 1 TL-2023]
MAPITPPPEPTTTLQPNLQKEPNGPDFDIVSTYKSRLASDPDLTPPIAAIESLILALTALPSTTISQTLSDLSSLSNTLQSSVPNRISLSAGTDLFQRYLITSLNRPASTTLATTTASGPSDFPSLRQHILSNGRLFVSRAKAARARIATLATPFLRDNCTILTNGSSRCVSALLHHASSSSSSIRFRVLYVDATPRAFPTTTPNSPPQQQNSNSNNGMISSLRSRGIPVATIPPSALAYALPQATMCIVGAEAIVENGGIVSRMGTYQMGLLAHATKKPFYVVAESYKFVRLYPLGQYDLPVRQRVVEFKTTTTTDNVGEGGGVDGKVESPGEIRGQGEVDGYFDLKGEGKKESTAAGNEDDSLVNEDETVDFTPPHLISALITENGVLTPSAVSEELIKLWF